MQAESTLAPVQIGGGTSVPSVFIPSYPRASAFPLPVARASTEPTRRHHRDLGRNAPEHARRVQQNNQQPRPRIVTLSATDDRPPLWFGCGRPRCGLWVELASHPHTPVLRGYTLGAFPNLVVVRFYASPDRSAVKPVGHLPAWTGLAPRHDRAPDLLVTQLARG